MEVRTVAMSLPGGYSMSISSDRLQCFSSVFLFALGADLKNGAWLRFGALLDFFLNGSVELLACVPRPLPRMAFALVIFCRICVVLE